MEGRGPLSTLARLLRLWRLYAKLDLFFVTRSFRTFVVWYLSDIILSIATVSGMLLLAERFAGIGVWSKEQVLFLLGYAATVGGLLEIFFGFNIAFISRRLGRGQFDHTLLQPQPVWMALLTEGFTPFAGSATLAPGIALLAWSVIHLHVAVSPGWLAMLLLSLAASAAVALAFQYALGSLAFWAPRAADEINSSSANLLHQLKTFPLDGLGPVLLGGLLSALPVGFVAWAPCRSLLGLTPGFWAALATPLAALLLGALAALLFAKGMRHYARTGSQRYSSFGHRR
ncbi:MAG TPA: ABC-2 family transporter protein [Chthonomonadaceae bacterium]|nr:ABC-2 family transporter protein [Chthonomonadaceae bacterium]